MYNFSYRFGESNKTIRNEFESIINTSDGERMIPNICVKHERTENIHNFCIIKQLLAYGDFEEFRKKLEFEIIFGFIFQNCLI